MTRNTEDTALVSAVSFGRDALAEIRRHTDAPLEPLRVEHGGNEMVAAGIVFSVPRGDSEEVLERLRKALPSG